MQDRLSGFEDWIWKCTAWREAEPLGSFDPDIFRRDPNGNLISWMAYNDRTSPWGWVVDRVASEGPKAVRAVHCRA